MAMEYNIDDDQVRRAFDRLVNAGINQTEALKQIGRYGVTSTVLRFKFQVDPQGKAWPKSKRVLKGGGQTLRFKSRLRNSFTWNVKNDGVEWGTNVVYARVHQDGYDDVQNVPSHQRRITKAWGKKMKAPKVIRVGAFRRKMHIPKRSFLGFNEADRAAALEILKEHYERAVAGP